MLYTLELLQNTMINNGGRYTQSIRNLPIGKRVKIVNIISVVGITTGFVTQPFFYWNSNLVQINSFDTLTNGGSNTLQVINPYNRLVTGGLTNYNVDNIATQFETVIPETITIEKRTGVNRTLLIDDVPFYMKIVMESID